MRVMFRAKTETVLRVVLYRQPPCGTAALWGTQECPRWVATDPFLIGYRRLFNPVRRKRHA